MLMREIVDKLSLEVVSGENTLDLQVTCAYVSDILSDVMSKAVKGSVWITNQTHENVVAIAFFKSLAGIIMPGGLQPHEETLQKAREKSIPIMLSKLSAFEIAGRIYELGIRGNK